MGNDVRIVKMDRAFSAYFWLCPKHVKAKKREGWDVLETLPPPHELPCEECRAEEAP